MPPSAGSVVEPSVVPPDVVPPVVPPEVVPPEVPPEVVPPEVPPEVVPPEVPPELVSSSVFDSASFMSYSIFFTLASLAASSFSLVVT